MIQLDCSNCKAVLAIDDAFAGGVCRCQQCGTIQTVPKPGAETAIAADSDSPKALFKRKARIESALSPYNDGLDRAADEMDSSGGLSASAIAGAALRRSPSPDDVGSSGQMGNGRPGGTALATAPARAATVKVESGYVPTPSRASQVVDTKRSRRAFVVAGAIGGAVVLALGGLLLVFASSGEDSPAAKGDDTVQVEEAKSKSLTVTGEGNICGIPLRSSSVVYVLDRSGVTQQAFGNMTSLCLKSAKTLGPARSFQMVVWNNHEPLAFPKEGPASAGDARIDDARKAIADTYAGSSNLVSHLQAAIADGAREVVILSAVDADSQLADEVAAAVKTSSLQVHTIAIGSDLQGDELRRIATSSGGHFRQLSLNDID